ncbi:MAG: hypothetical protein AAB489_01900 [Patescibacteria group bacterium]
MEQGASLKERRQEFNYRIATLIPRFSTHADARNEMAAEDEALQACYDLGNLYPDAKEHYPERRAVRLAIQYALHEFPKSKKLKTLLESLQ